MTSRKREPGALNAKQLKDMNSELMNSPQAVQMQNAVAETPVTRLALRRSVVTGTDHSFSIHLDKWQVTNQKSSGRCWLFAGLNLFRTGAMKKMKLKNFEFSQNYALFWDKMERANHFMENSIATSKQDVADREVAFLLSDPIGNGGQWNMFINVIHKHGVVAKSAMPETQSSSSTGLMNRTLKEKLREAARDLRAMAASGADLRTLRREKNSRLETIYRILCIHLGTPPDSFDWQWKDKDGKFRRDGKMTPKQFAKKYITIPMNDYVCLVHDPRKGHAFGRTYTIKFLGNVVGGAPVIYLNVDIDTMNDSRFNEYMFEIAARKSRLPAKLQAALKKPPKVLPPWDPMGSLAA